MAKYGYSEVRDRLKQYIAYQGMSVRSFQDAARLSNSYVASIDQSIAPKTQKKIVGAFPDLNMSWLLTGEGSMIKQPTSSIHDNNVIGDNNNVGNNINVNHTSVPMSGEQHVKPIIPKYLASQPNTDVYQVVMTDNALKLDTLTTFPPYVDFDFYYQVRQDAMQPLYMVGDVIALAHTEGDNIIQGAAMVIDTNDFGFLLRRIYDRGDYYECRVINDKSAYESQTISKDNVIRLYRVMYSIRLGD